MKKSVMTASRTPDGVHVQPRDVHFDLSSAGAGFWLGGDPVGTAVFNALSLTFPDGERMFMDAVRHYRSQLRGKLADDVRGFVAQEAAHLREHRAFNQLIDRNRYPVAAIEAKVRQRIAAMRSRGPMATLVVTIALEHFTAMMAEMHDLQRDLFEGVSPDIERLWRWHAMEETEHKAVAFDVFIEVTRDWQPVIRYLRRAVSMAIIGPLFTRNITRYAALLLEADGYPPKTALAAVRKYVWKKPGLFRRGWKSYLAWFRPGFHPWDIDNRTLVATWKAEFGDPSAELGG
jgi:predicted metal-dependent hydrolase